jgi:hypothetical protein
MVEVIERARRYVAKCPAGVSGQGGHDATFHAAAVLVWGFALGETEALMLLNEYNGRCVPPWSERELQHKVRSAAQAAHREPRGWLLNGAPVPVQERARPVASLAKPQVVDAIGNAKRFLRGFRCDEAELFSASPVEPGIEPRFDGALLIEALYRPGELVNVVTEFQGSVDQEGERKARPTGVGKTRESRAMAAEFQEHGACFDRGGAWLRMNPLDGHGVADTNVTAFRFALIESDRLPVDLQLSLFAKLPLRVAAIIGSGGRSAHAWVRLDAANLGEYRAAVAKLFSLLARFGVDGKNKNPSRLSRLPGAKREIGAEGDGMQRLLYLNPSPEERAIL